jgi:hypothetical protein
MFSGRLFFSNVGPVFSLKDGIQPEKIGHKLSSRPGSPHRSTTFFTLIGTLRAAYRLGFNFMGFGHVRRELENSTLEPQLLARLANGTHNIIDKGWLDT